MKVVDEFHSTFRVGFAEWNWAGKNTDESQVVKGVRLQGRRLRKTHVLCSQGMISEDDEVILQELLCV